MTSSPLLEWQLFFFYPFSFAYYSNMAQYLKGCVEIPDRMANALSIKEAREIGGHCGERGKSQWDHVSGEVPGAIGGKPRELHFRPVVPPRRLACPPRFARAWLTFPFVRGEGFPSGFPRQGRRGRFIEGAGLDWRSRRGGAGTSLQGILDLYVCYYQQDSGDKATEYQLHYSKNK